MGSQIMISKTAASESSRVWRLARFIERVLRNSHSSLALKDWKGASQMMRDFEYMVIFHMMKDHE